MTKEKGHGVHLPSYDYLQVIWFVRGVFSSQTGGLGGAPPGGHMCKSTGARVTYRIPFLLFFFLGGVVGGEFCQAIPKSKLIFQHTVFAKGVQKWGRLWW